MKQYRHSATFTPTKTTSTPWLKTLFFSAALFIIILCFLLLLVGHEDLILLHKVSDLAVHPADHASPGRLERRNKHICYCTVQVMGSS